MNIEALLAQLADLASLDDAALAALIDDLAASAAEIADGADDAALATLEQIADGIDAARGEVAARDAAAAERVERVAAILDRISPAAPADTALEADEVADGAAVEAAAAAVHIDMAAAGAPTGNPAAAVTAPRVARVEARRPASLTPQRSAAALDQRPALSLVAAANVPGINAGTPIRDARQMGEAIIAAARSMAGWQGPVQKVPVFTVHYGDAFTQAGRMLGHDGQVNAERIDAVTSLSALTASGGICAPSPVRYDLPILDGSTARPVRDEMCASFGADRGGVTLIPPPVLTDLDGSRGVWTEANDQSPSSPATKECLTMTCPNDETTVVEAIFQCIKYGNFRARFWPEQVAAWMRLAMVNVARYIESRHLTRIGTLSTQVTSGQMLGTARDVLTTLDRAASQIRNRHRLSPATPLRFAYPAWLHDQIRSDIARQFPVGSTDETLALADATIDRWFRSRSVNPTKFLDGETGQVFGAQNDGALLGWPSTVVTYLYPEGSFLHLDGGQLDIGLFRDGSLIETNDVKVFAESFEAIAFHGVESYRLEMDVCPDGSVSAAVDISPCSTGS